MLGDLDGKHFLKAAVWGLAVFPALQLLMIVQHVLEGWEETIYGPRSMVVFPVSVVAVSMLSGLVHRSRVIPAMTLAVSGAVVSMLCFTPLSIFLIPMFLLAGYSWG